MLTAPRQLTAVLRRLAQEGLSPAQIERGVDLIENSLADDGPLVRNQLAERFAGGPIPVRGQAFSHLLGLASLRGLTVRGPMVGKQHAYVLVRDWLGEPGAVDRDAALVELGRRYLAGHGPADERDLAYWTGLPLRDARAALAGCRPRRRRAAKPPTRLLGPYDPMLHGWPSRKPLLGKHDPAIVTGGIFRPFALFEGRPVATWRLTQGRVELKPFETLNSAGASALAADAADVERFFASGSYS